MLTLGLGESTIAAQFSNEKAGELEMVHVGMDALFSTIAGVVIALFGGFH